MSYIQLKKCANPECDHEFPEHYFSDLCAPCARAAEMEKLTLSNFDAPVLEVKHADLERSDDNSPYRSMCPACKVGTLLVCRDPGTFKLRKQDRCCLCGQPVLYLDIKDMRAKLG